MSAIQYIPCGAPLKRRIGDMMGEKAERHIQLAGGFALLAMSDEIAVGLIAVHRRELSPPLLKTAEGFVNLLEVDMAFRRRSIARRLIELSIERCRSLGLHQIRAWSSEDKTEAIPMWKALGFAHCPATEHLNCPGFSGGFMA